MQGKKHNLCEDCNKPLKKVYAGSQNEFPSTNVSCTIFECEFCEIQYKHTHKVSKEKVFVDRIYGNNESDACVDCYAESSELILNSPPELTGLADSIKQGIISVWSRYNNQLPLQFSYFNAYPCIDGNKYYGLAVFNIVNNKHLMFIPIIRMNDTEINGSPIKRMKQLKSFNVPEIIKKLKKRIQLKINTNELEKEILNSNFDDLEHADIEFSI